MTKYPIILRHVERAICDSAGITTNVRFRGNSKDRRRNKRWACGLRSDFLASHCIAAHINKRESDVFESAFSWCVKESEASHE